MTNFQVFFYNIMDIKYYDNVKKRCVIYLEFVHVNNTEWRCEVQRGKIVLADNISSRVAGLAGYLRVGQFLHLLQPRVQLPSKLATGRTCLRDFHFIKNFRLIVQSTCIIYWPSWRCLSNITIF